MNLICAVHATVDGATVEAITVVNGTAVCTDHVETVAAWPPHRTFTDEVERYRELYGGTAGEATS